MQVKGNGNLQGKVYKSQEEDQVGHKGMGIYISKCRMGKVCKNCGEIQVSPPSLFLL